MDKSLDERKENDYKINVLLFSILYPDKVIRNSESFESSEGKSFILVMKYIIINYI